MRKLLLLLIIISLGHIRLSAFQQQRTISSIYEDILRGQSEFKFDNIEFVDDVSELMDESDPDTLQYVNAIGEILGVDDIVSELYELELTKIDVLNSSGSLFLYYLSIDTVDINESQFDILDVSFNEISALLLAEDNFTELYIDTNYIGTYSAEDCVFSVVDVVDNVFEELFDEFQADIQESYTVEGNDFYDGLGLDFAEAHSNAFVTITDNIFESRKSKMYIKDGEDSAVFRTQFILTTIGDLSELYLVGNQFLSDGDNEIVSIEANFNDLVIGENIIENDLLLDGSVQNYLNITENQIERKVSMTDLNIRETGRMQVSLDSLLSNKLAIAQFQENYSDISFESENLDDHVIQSRGQYFHFSNEKDGVLNQAEFNTLISDYYRIHAFYKENGYHEYADRVYLSMKDVELRKLHAEWLEQGGLERLIKWQLNSILKFYTKYGTSPTRAIIISFYVLLAFTLFYFFFPSEWDTRSKAQILIDFRYLRQKNDKGYIKPFFALIYDLSRSFVNAFSLSLNAFITLGFGAIPTTGLARYVCIFQGFLGWFLLSIFTASLISQILY